MSSITNISIAALRRELLRNGQLRDLCGFDPFDGAQAVPREYAYTRFQRRLRRIVIPSCCNGAIA